MRKRKTGRKKKKPRMVSHIILYILIQAFNYSIRLNFMYIRFTAKYRLQTNCTLEAKKKSDTLTKIEKKKGKTRETMMRVHESMCITLSNCICFVFCIKHMWTLHLPNHTCTLLLFHAFIYPVPFAVSILDMCLLTFHFVN